MNPVVMENHAGCNPSMLAWLKNGRERASDNPELLQGMEGLEAYGDKDKRKYVHFVDGGITDNLGLRAIYEVVEMSGGENTLLKSLDRKPPSKLIFISVNASTDPAPAMDQSNAQPSLEEAIKRVSSTQIHRYSAATLELMEITLPRWAEEISTPKQAVKSHFIQLSFKHIDKPDLLRFFNLIPISFGLNDEQVDKLIEAGRHLIRYSPDFQRLVAELGGVQEARQ
jgi:NTE family protein